MSWVGPWLLRLHVLHSSPNTVEKPCHGSGHGCSDSMSTFFAMLPRSLIFGLHLYCGKREQGPSRVRIWQQLRSGRAFVGWALGDCGKPPPCVVTTPISVMFLTCRDDARWKKLCFLNACLMNWKGAQLLIDRGNLSWHCDLPPCTINKATFIRFSNTWMSKRSRNNNPSPITCEGLEESMDNNTI